MINKWAYSSSNQIVPALLFHGGVCLGPTKDWELLLPPVEAVENLWNCCLAGLLPVSAVFLYISCSPFAGGSLIISFFLSLLIWIYKFPSEKWHEDNPKVWSLVEERPDIKDGTPISSCVNCMKHEHQLMMDHASPLPQVVEKSVDPEIHSSVLLASFILGRPCCGI